MNLAALQKEGELKYLSQIWLSRSVENISQGHNEIGRMYAKEACVATLEARLLNLSGKSAGTIPTMTLDKGEFSVRK